MAKTMIRVRRDGVAFYLNTETSSPSSNRNRTRYRLFKTEDLGRVKCGYVHLGSIAGQALLAITSETERFDACVTAFASKKPYQYRRPEQIRGRPGPWEGEVFPARQPAVTDFRNNQNLTRQASNHSDN